MAKYEKRHTKKVKLNKKSRAERPVQQKPERIKMAHTTEKKEVVQKPRTQVRTPSKKQPYRVIKGKLLKKRTLLLGGIAAVCLFLIICQVSLPTGILEFLQNSYSLQSVNGSGTDSLMGTSFLQVNARYGRIDLLSGAYYEVYNKDGGTAYTVQHGYSAPVMATSAARTLIYSRNGSDCSVYNLSRCVQNLTVEGKIYTGTISRNARVALAYKSNDYVSVIEVFSKTGKSLFTKNFSSEYVTSMSLNSSGKYLTATTLYSKGGIYHSNLYVFNVNSEKLVSKNEYENMYFNAAETLGSGSALALSYDKAVISFPSKGEVKSLDFSEKISNYSVSKNGTIGLVCNHENNTIDNLVRIYNKKGDKKTELSFKGSIDGFSISNSHIYILSGGVLFSYTIKNLKMEETPFENAQLLCAFNGGAAAVSGAKLLLK